MVISHPAFSLKPESAIVMPSVVTALCWQLVFNGYARTGAKIGFPPQEALFLTKVTVPWLQTGATQNEPGASLVLSPLAARLHGPFFLSHRGNAETKRLSAVAPASNLLWRRRVVLLRALSAHYLQGTDLELAKLALASWERMAAASASGSQQLKCDPDKEYEQGAVLCWCTITRERCKEILIDLSVGILKYNISWDRKEANTNNPRSY